MSIESGCCQPVSSLPGGALPLIQIDIGIDVDIDIDIDTRGIAAGDVFGMRGCRATPQQVLTWSTATDIVVAP